MVSMSQTLLCLLPRSGLGFGYGLESRVMTADTQMFSALLVLQYASIHLPLRNQLVSLKEAVIQKYLCFHFFKGE